MKSKLQLSLFFLLFIFLLDFLSLKSYSQTLLKGGITAVFEKGQIVEVDLSTPINYYFSQVGDDITAFTKEDILIGDDFYIPKGSRLAGKIIGIKEPKSFGQNGAFEIEFNEIITPDNFKIPIYVSISTDTSKLEEKVADILTYDASLITYGTFHGIIASFQYGGIPLAVASHGISLLAGAGVGAGAGIIGSVLRKGRVPVNTGADTQVALKTNLYVFGELPKLEELRAQSSELQARKEYLGFRFFPQVKKEDIELKINNVKKEHSKIYGDYIVLNFKLKNNSTKTISLSDFVLLNESIIEPLHPDLFLSGTEALKSIKPFDESSASLAFIITKKINDYCLSLIDPLDRKVVLRVPLYEK